MGEASERLESQWRDPAHRVVGEEAYWDAPTALRVLCDAARSGIANLGVEQFDQSPGGSVEPADRILDLSKLVPKDADDWAQFVRDTIYESLMLVVEEALPANRLVSLVLYDQQDWSNRAEPPQPWGSGGMLDG